MKKTLKIFLTAAVAVAISCCATYTAQAAADADTIRPIPCYRYYTVHIDNPYAPALPPSKLDGSKKLPDMLENVGLWYLLQNLKKDMPRDKELRNAMQTVINYAENKRLRRQIENMKVISEQTGEKVAALNVIQKQVTKDSLRYEDDYDGNNDLQLLVSAVRSDSVFGWLEKISRDSSQIEFVNDSDNIAATMWINTRNRDFRRLWLRTTAGDTIGAWLEAIPGGNKMRINLEGIGASQVIRVNNQNKDVKLNNSLNSDYFRITDLHKEEIARKYWSYYSSYTLSLNQAAVKNWASGGQNSMSMILKTGFYANYNRHKLSWENYLLYNLGMLWAQSEKIRKSDDYLEINTKIGYKASKNWYYTFQFNMQSQLFNTYNYSGKSRTLISNIFSPVYMVPSLGMNFKPNANVSLLLAPIAGKMTIVRDTKRVSPTRYGVPEDKHIKSSVGANINYNHAFKNIWDIMDLNSAFDMFVYYSNEYKIPLYVDWKLNFKFKINYFLSTTLYAECMYNESYSEKLQFKETLGLTMNITL